MVRAILDGRKTMTRRVMKPQAERGSMNALDVRGESPPACEDYLGEAMDYIIDQIGWADKFPRQCHDPIRKVCEAVKRAEPLPFKPNNRIQRTEYRR
jgi:hypothetical protein